MAPAVIFLVYHRSFEHDHDNESSLQSVLSVHTTLEGANKAAESHLRRREEDCPGTADIEVESVFDVRRGRMVSGRVIFGRQPFAVSFSVGWKFLDTDENGSEPLRYISTQAMCLRFTVGASFSFPWRSAVMIKRYSLEVSALRSTILPCYTTILSLVSTRLPYHCIGILIFPIPTSPVSFRNRPA